MFDEFGSFHLSQLVSKDKSLMSYHFGEPFPWLSVKIYARPFWLKRYVIRFQVDVSLADLPPCPNPVSVSFSVQRTVLGLMAIVNPASERVSLRLLGVGEGLYFAVFRFVFLDLFQCPCNCTESSGAFTWTIISLIRYLKFQTDK